MLREPHVGQVAELIAKRLDVIGERKKRPEFIGSQDLGEADAWAGSAA